VTKRSRSPSASASKKTALVLQPEPATPAAAVTSAKTPRPSFCSRTFVPRFVRYTSTSPSLS
jgi:hypothetical protein